MGFMSGFADGFGRQMEAGQQRKAVKERDALTMAMDRWNKRTEEYRSAEAEDRKLQTAAKQIATTNGLPEGAWVDIYGRLQGGDTFTGAEKWATGQKWSVEDQTPSMPDTPQAPTGPATPEGPVPTTAQDQQMSESGLAPGQAETPGQTDPGILGSMAGELGSVLGTIGNPQAQQERLMTKANEQAISGMGLTEEEVAQYEGGYKSTVPATSGVTYKPTTNNDDLKGFNDEHQVLFIKGPNGKTVIDYGIPDGNGGFKDNQGRPIQGDVTRSMPQTSYNDYIEAVKLVGPTIEDLNMRKENVIDVAVEADNLRTIVEGNPRVLTWAGTASSAINDGITNLVSLADAGAGFSSPEWQEREQSMIQEAQKGLGIVGQDANDYAAFMSAKLKFAFAAARASAGTGPLSNQEVQQHMSAFGTADKDDFNRQVQQYVRLQVDAYDRRATSTLERNLNVKTAEMQGIDIQSLVGPIRADQEISEYLDAEFTGGDVPTEPVAEAPTNIPTGARGKMLDDATAELWAKDIPEIVDYIGKTVYVDPATGEVFDENGQPIGE